MNVVTPLRRRPDAEETPLRAELYSADQMERHGEALAAAHQLRPGRRLGPRGDRLLARLSENESVLVATGELLKAAVTAGQPIAPAGEWLLDNFHLIEEQVRTGKRHLPKAYSRASNRSPRGPRRRPGRNWCAAASASPWRSIWSAL